MRTLGIFARRAAPKGSKRRRSILAVAAAVIAAVATVVVASAGATTPTPPCATANTLNTGAAGGGQSTFEIDAPFTTTVKSKTVTTKGANLTLDGSATNCTDWTTKAAGAGSGTSADLTPGAIVKADKASGSGDDSFGQGTSENDANPTIVSGSIPPNKSDLQDFGVYNETNPTGKFLDLFWSRINTPSGTTDMAFELNKLACNPTATPTNCATNGVTPQRSNGDKLINYKLSSGGTVPILEVFTWSTSSGWSTPTVISGTASPEALGSVNFDSISSTDSGGLGQKDPLTFGEASVSFKALFSGSGGSCGSFGSVYLKSQASDGLTDEEKDFIAPQPVLITNCTTLTTNASNGTKATAQTLKTTSPANTISDTATLSGASNPTGTISFKAYGPFDSSTDPSTDTCTDPSTGVTGNRVFSGSGQSLTGPDASGNYTASDSFTPTSAGRYEWVASYSGDVNNAASTTKCGDANEQSYVKETPGLTTSLSTSTATVGDSVHDSATLTWNSSLTPSGTVTYTVYSNNTCTTQATTGSTGQIDQQPGASAGHLDTPGTVTVASNGSVPDSGSVTFQKSGTYYWQASYSGDDNFNTKTSDCTSETLVVNQLNSTISTTQSWFPQDTATIDHSGGMVVFTLYKNVTDTTACTGGTTVYGPTSAISVVPTGAGGTAPFQASTSNTTFSVTSVTAGDTYYWKAAYTSGDAAHKDVTSTCQESTGFASLNNGSSVTSQ